MPEAGEYLLAHVGFSRDEKPLLALQKDGQSIDFTPLGSTLMIRFEMSTRFCVGWHDLKTGESHPCPDKNTTNGKYEQCAACQSRTGFNPAFYHATSVSTQQEARNQEPHILYLAHFGAGVVKVGISHAARGNGRLIEQGARSALILDTFPSAHIARQYEAKIAALSGIAETIQLRKKITELSHPYNTENAAAELRKTRAKIEVKLKVSFAQNHVQTFDNVYFPAGMPNFADAYDMTNDAAITGKVSGMTGSLLFCEYPERPLFLPLKKFAGYRFDLQNDVAKITFPARQISLF